MPMLRPLSNETRDQFIRRFMSNAAMRREYPNQSQRAAIANSQWRRNLKAAIGTWGVGSGAPGTPGPPKSQAELNKRHDWCLGKGTCPFAERSESDKIRFTRAKQMQSNTDDHHQIELACAIDQSQSSGKFTMTLYSGGPMRPRGYREDVVLDLKGLKVSSDMIPILADHDNRTDSVVGQGKAIVSDNNVTVTGLTTEATTAGRRISQMLKEGIPLQASIGANGIVLTRLNRDEIINGRPVKAGTLVVRSANLKEATVTPLGGDSATSVLAASQRRAAVSQVPARMGVFSSEENLMNFEEFVASLGLDINTLNDDQKTVLQAAYDNGAAQNTGVQNEGGQNDPPGSSGATGNLTASGDQSGNAISPHEPGGQAAIDSLFASMVPGSAAGQSGNTSPAGQTINREELQAAILNDVRAGTAAELDRIHGINTLVANYDDQVPSDDLATLQATAVRENWHPDQLELELLRAARPNPTQFAIHSSTDGVAPAQVIEASLLLACGRMDEEQVGEHFNEDVMHQASEARFRGYGIRRLAHETIQAAGMHVPPGQYDNNFIRTMLQADSRLDEGRDLYAATSMGGVSTVSVSGILSNVMHKLLLQSFLGDSNGMTSLQAISSVRSVNDFKDHHIYRLTADGSYQQVSAAGDLKYMSLQQAENTINAQTYGVMMGLNRHMIINDDLNAFSKVPSLIGRQARMKFLRIGWATFLDNGNFYTPSRGNMLTDTIFNIDGLTEAVVAFSKIRDDNGDPIDTVPRMVLVPSKYQVAADQIYRDTTILLPQKYGGLDKELSSNPHRGKYNPYSTSWIDGTGALVPGGNDDDWYIFSGEQDMLPLQVAYLNGNRTPYMERVDLPADKLGMGWRSYFDFGFARQEWRGSIKCQAVTTHQSSAPQKSAVQKRKS